MCGMYTLLKSKSPTFSLDAMFTINGNIETADIWRHLGHVNSSNMHDAIDAVINLLVKLTTSCVH